MRQGFLHRHAVACFFILAMALGAGIVSLVVSGILSSSLALASVLSASIAGIAMTAIEDGRAGLKLLLSRVLIWRVRAGYWIVAILFPIPVFLLGSLFNPIFGGDAIDLSNLVPAFPILPAFVGFFVVAGLGQELGWAGYLLPRLQARSNALVASFVRAILAGIWHLPLLIYARLEHPALASFPYSGWIAQMGFPFALAVLFLMFLVPWSILYTWIFNNTQGSLLLVALLHASEIWVVYLMMSTGIDPNNIDNYWGYGGIMVLVATLVAMIAGSQNLSRKYHRIVRGQGF
jgi:membrane protease YdiL (CAAX protease family)